MDKIKTQKDNKFEKVLSKLSKDSQVFYHQWT